MTTCPPRDGRGARDDLRAEPASSRSTRSRAYSSKKLLDAFTASLHLTSLRHVAFMYGEEADHARVFARAPLPAPRELRPDGERR